VGVELTEYGRRADIQPPLEPGKTVTQEFEERNRGVSDMLRGMEEKEPAALALWEETKQWSLQEFKQIYAWLGARFDHDFYESEVSEPSQRLVDEYLAKGLFINSNGALGMDLAKHKLGFCMVRKSDGSGLYATKDLALAKVKFERYQIDRSVYVVDAAQTLHFQQVFKVLELMGYEQAKKCFHLPYGTVLGPNGEKMSSRKGTVIYFSALKDKMYNTIYEKNLKPNEGKWPAEEIEEAKRRISVAAIRYGMLNTDALSDICFDLEAWGSVKGNTGPYLLYAHTRIRKIIKDVPVAAGAKPDFAYLDHPVERRILIALCDFWVIVQQAVRDYNASPLCIYLFDLCKAFSSWYDLDNRSVKFEQNPDIQATRLLFIEAVAETIKTGLSLLGIQTVPRM